MGNPREYGVTTPPPREYWTQVEQRVGCGMLLRRNVKLYFPESQGAMSCSSYQWHRAMISVRGTVQPRGSRVSIAPDEHGGCKSQEYSGFSENRKRRPIQSDMSADPLPSQHTPSPFRRKGILLGGTSLPDLSYLSSYANASHPSRPNISTH